MKQYIKSIGALTVICVVVAVLLAATNFITAPIIEKNEAAAANEALLVVMPNGEEFTAVDLTKYTLPESITEAYSEKNGGYVFKMTVSGYQAGMVIMCGIDKDGVVTGAVCLSSAETLGYQETYGTNLTGVNIDTVDSVDTVAGATRTTQGYKNAVKDALNAFVILQGGSVDLRTEEEILADNLNIALPSGNGKFTKWFMVEKLEGVSAVYIADNGEGAVYVVGESFVGVDADGNIVTDVDVEIKNTVENSVGIVNASNLTEIDIAQYELSENVLEVYKTESGNYKISVRASGYGIKGDHASGEYIYIDVSITADGEIIATETVSQGETDGIGSTCAEESFYSQFNGKTEETYENIDAIAGATITTNGYKTAIGEALAAVKIMEGEA